MKAEKSFADAVKNTNKSENVCIKTIVQEARNEEEREIKDKRSRANNIIIYGIPETSSESPEETQDQNNQIVTDLLRGVNFKINAKFIARIGSRQPSKSRPIKVSFKSSKDKETIMKNLKLLKGRRKYFGRLY